MEISVANTLVALLMLWCMCGPLVFLSNKKQLNARKMARLVFVGGPFVWLMLAMVVAGGLLRVLGELIKTQIKANAKKYK